MYPKVQLLIAGQWRDANDGQTLTISNPATEKVIGTVAHASESDLDEAVDAVALGFKTWRAISGFERCKIMRRAAALLRERAEQIAPWLTMEQGKPLAESLTEIQTASDVIEWFAEEARRTYGRTIPARIPGVRQVVEQEPIGPVAAFTPWNYPIGQAVRKVAAALAAGCAIGLKGPEETPAACAALFRAFHDAGVPAGVVNLVFGTPAQISQYLIAHPVIRKVSFTGSTAVGKQLASLAGLHMKPVTMELGGHAPVLVFGDADLAKASLLLARAKFRNAGQICTSPTRFLIHDSVYDDFLQRFTTHMAGLQVGNGMLPEVTMGAMANGRRINMMEDLVADATRQGAKVHTGGACIGHKGHFFQPTVLTDLPLSARAMNEEPFGPLALFMRFSTQEQALTEANRLPYGLASYVYTSSAETANQVSAAIESGMVTINHHGLALPETPFGGVKDSGYGSEGGTEAVACYLVTKFISRTQV